MDTFFHKFGMFEEAPARRWVNPDRSEGAIVATSATVDPYTHLPHQTVVGPHARIGAQASIGEAVSIASHAQVGNRVSFGAGVSVGGHTIVNDDCRIGERASLEEGVVLSEGVSIGAHAHLGARTWVGRHAAIDDGGLLMGSVLVGERARIGFGASIDQLARIGFAASIGSKVTIEEAAMIGDYASIGENAAISRRTVIGDGVEYDAGDWLFVVGPNGVNQYWVTAVWSPKHDLRWWIHWGVGSRTVRAPKGLVAEVLSFELPCTSEQFIARIAADPRGSPVEDFHHLVRLVTGHPALARAMNAGTRQ
jgi:UDP-3-O-[3-hydroxymyristoyl] glucosamine N-acyltransferase